MKRYTWEEAMRYAANLTSGGHTDWRVPSIKELLSLFDYETGKSIIPMVSSYYWSSTAGAYHPGNAWYVYAWYVNFSNGYVNYGYKNSDGYVRCVRGGQVDYLVTKGLPDNMDRIVDNGDGTITDNLTGLMWEMGGEKLATAS